MSINASNVDTKTEGITSSQLRFLSQGRIISKLRETGLHSCQSIALGSQRSQTIQCEHGHIYKTNSSQKC